MKVSSRHVKKQILLVFKAWIAYKHLHEEMKVSCCFFFFKEKIPYFYCFFKKKFHIYIKLMRHLGHVLSIYCSFLLDIIRPFSNGHLSCHRFILLKLDINSYVDFNLFILLVSSIHRDLKTF
jgi:hypothetical protein